MFTSPFKSGRRAVATLAGVAVLTAGLTVAPAGASPPGGPPDWLPDVADSRDLASPVVATGRLQNAAGTAMPGRVMLLAWPDHDTMSAMQPGDQVKLVPVAKTEAGPDGRFTLRVDPKIGLGQFMSRRGGTEVVDFEVVATDGTETAVFAFPRRLHGNGSTQRWAGLEDLRPQDIASRAPLDVVLRLGMLGGSQEVGEAVAVAEPGTVATDKFCYSTLRETFSPVWDLIGDVYTGPNTEATYTYTQEASSTLGVGVSSSGNFGTWSASGTSSKSSTAAVAFPKALQNKKQYFDTQFRYGKYWVYCVDPYSGIMTANWYETRVKDWVGGSRVRNIVSAPTANNCTPYAKGSSFTRDSKSAVTWSNGVDIKGIIGIDLSTKTGFTTKAKVKYTFINAGQLCGTNAFPPDSLQIVAK